MTIRTTTLPYRRNGAYEAAMLTATSFEVLIGDDARRIASTGTRNRAMAEDLSTFRWVARIAAAGSLAMLACILATPASADKTLPVDLDTEYTKAIRPLVVQYCLDCHSGSKKKG